jgi:hypothetical protein
MDTLFAFKAIRKALQNLLKKPNVDFEGHMGQNAIHELIRADAPCLISRIGSSEMNILLTDALMREPNIIKKTQLFIRGAEWGWNRRLKHDILYNSGFIAHQTEDFQKFCQIYLKDLSEIDLLGSWLLGEKNFSSQFLQAKTMPLRDLEPSYHQPPWTSQLQGKRVLVVHPFEATITQQYQQHQKQLYPKSNLLPEFKLITYKAKQTIALKDINGQDWFQNLNHMIKDIQNIDFDMAIIGAGAYGLPIAADIKRSGRKAIHLGGSTQILFGIKGKRWDAIPHFKALYNSHWTYPLPEDTPEQYRKAEGGGYW